MQILQCEENCETDPAKISEFFDSFFVELTYIVAKVDWEVKGKKPIKFEKNIMMKF